jgi:hypothetical protein
MNLNELLASPVGTLERMTLQIKGVGEYSDRNGKGASAQVQLSDGTTQYPTRVFLGKKPDTTHLTNADLGAWIELPLTRKDNGEYRNVQLPWGADFQMSGPAATSTLAPPPTTAPAQTLSPSPVASTAKAIRTSCSFNGAIRLAAAGKIDVTEVKKYVHFFDALLRDAINHEPAVVDNVSAQVQPGRLVQPPVQLQDHAAAVEAGVAPPEEDLPF